MRVVSPTATHEVAATDVLHHCLVAHPSLCPQAPCQRVRLAVVRGLVYVHQLCIQRLPVRVRFFNFEEFGTLAAASFDGFHVHCMGIFLLENVAKLAELGKCSPAGFGCAGARDTMTLAFQSHALLQNLDTEKQLGKTVTKLKWNFLIIRFYFIPLMTSWFQVLFFMCSQILRVKFSQLACSEPLERATFQLFVTLGNF